MDKNEKAASAVAPVKTTAQTMAVSKTVILPKVVKEKSEIDLLREKLQAELDRLTKKSQLAQQRVNFITTRDKIKSFAAEASKNQSDEFNNEESRLQLTAGRYRGDTVISVASYFVLERFCVFIDAEIAAKITRLEAELLED